jgi:hypothetical protein
MVISGLAKSGSEWEKRFSAATSAETALEIVTELHRDFLPWDLPEVLQLEVIAQDPHSWLKGAVTPEVRAGLGRTKWSCGGILGRHLDRL